MNPATTPESPSDRRIAPRFQPAFGTVYRYRKSEGDSAAMGLVWNLSQTGVSMLLAEPPERGGVVEGELAAEGGDSRLSIPVRVVHVRMVSTGDYLLGGQFVRRLEPSELQAFLTPPPRERPEKPRS